MRFSSSPAILACMNTELPNVRPLRAVDMRRQNAAMVLHELRSRGAQSRAELAATTTLTTEGVRELLADLQGLGLVLEAEPPIKGPRRGRPATFYSYNAGSAMAIGVSLAPKVATVVCTDAVGIEQDRLTFRIQGLAPSSTINKLVRTVKKLIEHIPDPQATVSMAVVINGDIDHESGMVRSASMEGWINVDIAERLGARLGLSVTCLDTASAVAVASRREGVAAGTNDVVVLDLSTWIAAGVVQAGELYRGANGLAGQIRDCPVPSNGQVKPLREVLAGFKIAEAAGLDADAGWRAVLDAAASGDQNAIGALAEARAAVVFASTWLICAYGPQLFVLGGVFNELDPIDRSRMVADIYQACGHQLARQVEVRGSSLGRDGWTRGAIQVALDWLHSAQVDSESSGFALAARRLS